MKVWVVKEVFDSHILGIYDSEDKAKFAFEALRGMDREDYTIIVFTLNETNSLY